MSETKSFQEKCRRLGAKIKYYRTIGGMNQTVLANKLGISYQYLSRIECGKERKNGNKSNELHYVPYGL